MGNTSSTSADDADVDVTKIHAALHALRTQHDDAAAVVRLCSTLYRELHQPGASRAALAKAVLQWRAGPGEDVGGGIAEVLRAMSTHALHPIVVEHACAVLRKVAKSGGSSAQGKIANVGGLTAVVRAMSDHAACVEVAQEACTTLAELALDNDAVKRKMVEASAIEAIVRVMSDHAAHTSAVEEACVALRYLSFTEECVTHIATVMQDGAVEEALLRALSMHATSEVIGRDAPRALGNLAGDDVCKVRIDDRGGVEAILRVITSAEYEPKMAPIVKSEACFALGHLAYQNTSIILKILDACGIGSVCNVMTAHADSKYVAEHACDALYRLASSPDSSVRDQAVAELVARGGIELVLRIFDRFSSECLVAQSALLALFHPTWRIDPATRIIDAGGISKILHVLSTHPSEPHALRLACDALGHLSAHESCRAKITEAGGIKALLKVVSDHPKKHVLVERACRVLQMFCTNDEGPQAAAANEVVAQTALATLKQQAASNEAVGLACELLMTLHMPAMQFIAADPDAVRALIRVLKDHADQEVVVRGVCITLCNLCEVPQARAAIVREGGIPVIIAAMRVRADEASAVKEALVALRNLAVFAENRPIHLEHGTIEATVKALSQHATDAEVSLFATELLFVLFHRKGLSSGGDRAFYTVVVDVAATVVGKIDDAGGAEALLKALTEHPSDHEIVQRACYLVAALARRSIDDQARIAAAGGIPIVMRALRETMSNQGAADMACAALDDVAGNAKNQLTIAQGGGVELVLQAMREHPSHRGVALQGCAALRHLAMTYEWIRDRIVHERGLETIVHALNEHGEDPWAAEVGCWAIENVCRDGGGEGGGGVEHLGVDGENNENQRPNQPLGCAARRSAARSAGAIAALEFARTRHAAKPEADAAKADADAAKAAIVAPVETAPSAAQTATPEAAKAKAEAAPAAGQAVTPEAAAKAETPPESKKQDALAHADAALAMLQESA